MEIRDALPADFPHLLELNAESVRYLSPLTREKLEQIHAEAAFHRVVDQAGSIVAFLLALREGCGCDSPNYRWFAARFDGFLYVDRIVVSRGSQGAGLGRLLYTDLFAFARKAGVTRITCEFDVEPPNEASRRFHAAFGFAEVGTQRLAGGKVVSLQAAVLR
jgi:predicted GNAT superfamily acetyltransferase